MSKNFDDIVIGAGHNGLACAFDLARKGRKVLVVEAAKQVGGAAVTRTFAPGFSVSACAHLLHALPASLVGDMDLERHGLRYASKSMPTHALKVGSGAVHIGVDQLGGVDSQSADVASYPDFRVRMAKYGKVLYPVLGMTPPSMLLKTWSDRFAMLGVGLSVRMLGKKGMRELLRIGGMNAYDLLDDNFSDATLKGALAFDATLGAEHGPRSPGTVLTWLYRLAGEGGTGAAGLAQPLGGLGAFSEAMATAVRAAGGEVRTDARVDRILVENDRAAGVRLISGESISSRTVTSSADPRSTFRKMLGVEHLDAGFVRRAENFRAKGLVAKLHLALSGKPDFTGVDDAALAGRLIISPSMDYLELAFNPSKYREIPKNPALEITVPTMKDPGLAPAGKHVISALIQFVPYDLGPDPAAAKAQLLENILVTLEKYAPGIRAQVVASELLTPSDLEREFGLAGGHWHQGALTFDQFFINRPFPLSQQYKSPVAGLYMCGASSHPGGSLMGFAGRVMRHAR